MTDKSKSNRRDFLRGKSAFRALQQIIEEPELPQPDAQQRAAASSSQETAAQEKTKQSLPSYLLQLSRKAMGCEFQISLNAGQYDGSTEQAVEALDLVESLENQLTAYNDRSELSQVNATAYQHPVVVAANFFRLLQQSMELYEATEHAFDITSGPLSKAWGFFFRDGRVPKTEQINQALARVGSDAVLLNEADMSIQFTRPGVEINLGGIGKGFTLDCCADLMLIDEIEHFLLHGGTSSVVARGSRKRTSEQSGWEIGVPHPLKPMLRIGKVTLHDEALGTSGAANQSFIEGGTRYGHILDPRTGYPAQGVLASTVIAPTAAEADALATSFYVMGVEKTSSFCQSRPDLGALMITEGERSGSIQLDIFGKMADKFQSAEEKKQP
ncbi:MAG: membrane-associated lipoprotein [Blastopirellula sp.]|nr:MAG: membrane-associated lipoprotein [Blastopirellula sp.]